jgi:hypothetical protein
LSRQRIFFCRKYQTNTRFHFRTQPALLSWTMARFLWIELLKLPAFVRKKDKSCSVNYRTKAKECRTNHKNCGRNPLPLLFLFSSLRTKARRRTGECWTCWCPNRRCSLQKKARKRHHAGRNCSISRPNGSSVGPNKPSCELHCESHSVPHDSREAS